jgi:hypothetical protein
MATASYSPAADRNKQPIFDVLQQVLAAQGTALEIAAGTGQHAAWFAARLSGWTWQPTDADEGALPGIAALAAMSGLSNVLPPCRLDVLAPKWPADAQAFAQPFDAIYCANMLHIAPWTTCAALMQGSSRHLARDGVLIAYGPFIEDGVATSAGNLSFDESLRAREPLWGIRRLEDVEREACSAGLTLRARHAMPANNLLLVFGRAAR